MTIVYRPAAELADHLLESRVVSRIWERDVSVWGASPASADARSISTRLGWLDVATSRAPELSRAVALGGAVREEQIEAVYLLGMGGSSLCAEVLRSVCGIGDGHPDLHVLDTTDEQTITTAAGRMNPERTLVLVASKSGATVEVASLERFFRARTSALLGQRAGRQFVAITDPETELQKLAESRNYRSVFLNPADIGGRFSALSLFGLVPAALIGASVHDLLAGAEAMAQGCRQENHTNAGLELGAFMGAAALDGRDKLTVLLPPSVASLGLWIEQLVAESTGKHGKGLLPVVDEPPGRPDEYGSDRAFISIATDKDAPDEDRLEALVKAGHPVMRLSTRLDGLGAEFFRWEFATAVAGAALGINPFDEPNVAEAKEKTTALLDIFLSKGTLPEPSPIAVSDAVSVYGSRFAGQTPAAVVRDALWSLRAGDYVAFLSYLPPSVELESAVREIRLRMRAKYRVASTFGVGPRYLHSTGQYHKGGPNTLLAFVITADDETETEIPDAGYSFAVLKRAQALGDVEALEAHGRRTVRIHVRTSAAEAPGLLERLFREAMP